MQLPEEEIGHINATTTAGHDAEGVQEAIRFGFEAFYRDSQPVCPQQVHQGMLHIECVCFLSRDHNGKVERGTEQSMR